MHLYRLVNVRRIKYLRPGSNSDAMKTPISISRASRISRHLTKVTGFFQNLCQAGTSCQKVYLKYFIMHSLVSPM